MKVNKMNIDHLIGKILREMAMDLPPDNTPHPDVTDKLAQGDTTYNNENLPPEEKEGQNFQELLASERYKEVVEKVGQYIGRPVSFDNPDEFPTLQAMTQGLMMKVLQAESQHVDELEKLAVELVMKEMAIPEGSFIFDVELITLEKLMAQLQQQQEQSQEEEEEVNIEGEEDLMNRMEGLDMERAKRRFINGMIQGASAKGYYMYHYGADKLAQITGLNTIANDYGILMSINDALYWQASDDQINQIMKMGSAGEAGEESVDRNTDPPTIHAKGFMFPALVHEIVKGVMEVFGVQGLPDNNAEEIMRTEDTKEKEIWDLRLGPAIWDRVRKMFPQDILVEENLKELQNYLLVAIFKLEAKQFLVFMKEVLSGTPEGKTFMHELLNGVRKAFNNEDYEPDVENLIDNINATTEETDDDELDDFLRGLGIGRPDEE